MQFQAVITIEADNGIGQLVAIGMQTHGLDAAGIYGVAYLGGGS